MIKRRRVKFYPQIMSQYMFRARNIPSRSNICDVGGDKYSIIDKFNVWGKGKVKLESISTLTRLSSIISPHLNPIISLSYPKFNRGSVPGLVLRPKRIINTSNRLYNTINKQSYISGSRRSKSTTSKSSSKSSFSPLSWYSSKLDTHPLLTKALTASFVAGGGDVGCQWIMQRDKSAFNWDAGRTGRFGFLGLALIAPVSHHWYGFVMGFIPGTGAVTVVKRVMCDQLLFAPLFIPTFVTSLKLLEGETLTKTVREVKEGEAE